MAAQDKKFDAAALAELDIPTTDFTKVVHQDTYPAIDPTRPELSQKGRTVLITGGGTNIGKSIAKAFAKAQAARVVIASRNKDVLEAAVVELSSFAASINSPTVFVSKVCDVSKDADVEGLWSWFAAEKITVDILVLNAAMFSEAKLLHNLGIQRLWAEFETNVKGPLHLTERFLLQKDFSSSPKSIVNVTTSAIHMLQNPIVAARPSYPLTKTAATFALMQVADAHKPEQLSVVNYHPGMLYGDGWKAFGITEDMIPFDSLDLPGSFGVWAASSQAHFLHGRYVLANWDVDELRTGITKANLDKNPDYLRFGIVGLRDTNRDY